MTQPLAGAKSVVTENELDIRGLFRVLWAGKLWIAGIALGFALLALAYTFFAKQEWSATQSQTSQRLTCSGDTIPSSNSCVTWTSKPVLLRQTRLPLWMKPIKSL